MERVVPTLGLQLRVSWCLLILKYLHYIIPKWQLQALEAGLQIRKPYQAMALPTFPEHGVSAILGNYVQKTHNWYVKEPHVGPESLSITAPQ